MTELLIVLLLFGLVVIIIVGTVSSNFREHKPVPPPPQPPRANSCNMPNCTGVQVTIKMKSPIGYEYEVIKCKKCGAVKGRNFIAVRSKK